MRHNRRDADKTRRMNREENKRAVSQRRFQAPSRGCFGVDSSPGREPRWAKARRLVPNGWTSKPQKKPVDDLEAGLVDSRAR